MIAAAGQGGGEEVLITLRLAPSPQNEAVAKKFVESVEKAERAAGAAADRAAGQRISAQEKATAAAEKARAKELAAAEKAAAAQTRLEEKKAAAAGRAAEKAERERTRAAEKAAREAAKLQADEERRQQQLFTNRAKLLDRIAKDEAKAAKEQERAASRASAAAESMESKRLGLTKRASEEGRKALQGTLDIVEGMAILGLTSEESLEKFARGFVQIQAGFKTVKGGIDVYFGLRDAIDAVRQATEAAAKAQILLAAGQKANLASAATSAVSSGAAGNLAGAAGGAAAGSAGASGIGALLTTKLTASGALAGLTSLGGAAKAAGAKFLVLGAAAIAITEALMAAKDLITGKSLGTSSVIGNTIGMIGDQHRAAESEHVGRIADSATARRNRMAGQANAALGRAGLQADFDSVVRNSQREQLVAGQGIGTNKLGEINRLRGFDSNAVGAAQADLNKLRGLEDKSRDAGGGANPQVMQAAVERLRDAQQKLLETDRQRVELLRQQAQEAQKEVDAKGEALQRAKELVKTEGDRFQGKLAAAGAMSQEQQAELQRIAGKVGSGASLSLADAKSLKELGVGTAKADEVFAADAKAKGLDKSLGLLGEGDALASAKAEQAKAEGELTAASQRAAQAQNEVSRAAAEAAKSLQAVSQTVNGMLQGQAQRSGLQFNQPTPTPTGGLNALSNPSPSDTLNISPSQITSALSGAGVLGDNINAASSDSRGAIEDLTASIEDGFRQIAQQVRESRENLERSLMLQQMNA